MPATAATADRWAWHVAASARRDRESARSSRRLKYTAYYIRHGLYDEAFRDVEQNCAGNISDACVRLIVRVADVGAVVRLASMISNAGTTLFDDCRRYWVACLVLEYGRLDVLERRWSEILKEFRIRPYEMAQISVLRGHLHVMRWLSDNGHFSFLSSPFWVEMAAEFGRFDAIRWLVEEQRAAVPRRAVNAAITGGDLATVRYILKASSVGGGAVDPFTAYDARFRLLKMARCGSVSVLRELDSRWPNQTEMFRGIRPPDLEGDEPLASFRYVARKYLKGAHTVAHTIDSRLSSTYSTTNPALARWLRVERAKPPSYAGSLWNRALATLYSIFAAGSY